MEFTLLWILAACLTGAQGNYQYVLAPNVIRLENNETLVVGILGDGKNQNLEIWFEYMNKKINNMIIEVPDAAHPKQVTVKVTADDLFKDIDVSPKFRDRPTSIKLVCKGPHGNQSQNITLSYTPGYLIVQTDKPLYNPSQKVQARVLAMDEALKPIRDKQIEIYLISPTDMTVAKNICAPGKIKGDNPFCRVFFDLPPFPDFGTWTIKAQFGGKLETFAIAPIEVREFVIPTFGVDVKPLERFILPNITTLTVDVSAMYVYGKPVEGNAVLNINIRKKGDFSDPKQVVTTEKLQLKNGKETFRINVTQLINKEFPTDATIELISTVFESATGKEQSGSDDSVTFINAPYKFDLSRCKSSYQRGYPYYMQVFMRHVDGTPAGETDIAVEIYNDIGRQIYFINKTNNDGHLLTVLNGFNTAVIRRLKVYSPGYAEYGAEMILKPYTGSNQIVVERVKKFGDTSFIQASTDIDTSRLNQYTGILFLIISRGKIVQTRYIENSNRVEFDLPADLVKKVSPVGRVFAFYVNKNNNNLAADSSVFYENPMCHEQLEIKPLKSEVRPGDSSKLNVTGPSGMWVGFNIIDTSLLLLNSDSMLKADSIFTKMEAHDLGCGAGGGVTSEEVLKNAGLTILINADIQSTKLYREKMECAENRRKRRAVPDTNGCYYGADPKCCEEAVTYALAVIHAYDIEKQHFDPEVSQPVPHTVCYAKARQLSSQYPDKLPTKCPLAFYEACFMTISAELSESNVASGRSVFSKFHDQYERDLDTFRRDTAGEAVKVRRHFDTSFFFEEKQLGTFGLETNIKYRDSMTTWSIQAIGITEDTGACIATPVQVTAFKECFVQVDLPYKVTRKENVNVAVTVFNYSKNKQVAKVYLKGVDNLCYGSSPGVASPPQIVSVDPNSANTLMFSMIALKAGSFPIVVTAFLSHSDGTSIDVVEKQLLVVSEGIQEKKNFTICLDPNKQMENCVHSFDVKEQRVGAEKPSLRLSFELPLTASALPGTVTANAYIKRNMMGEPVACVLEGVDKRFKEPSGCGEQNMVKTAPIVYGLYFLKQTGRMTDQHEASGIQKMKKGILHQISGYQKPDGSFAIWKDSPASLWLTAFVAKVFCQAEQIVKGVVMKEDLQKMLSYIAKNNIYGTGFFFDAYPVMDKHMQGILGKGERQKDPALTAFVLTALQECLDRTQEVEYSIHQAMSALEKTQLLSRKVDPYVLAISTYALAMSNSSRKAEFKTHLFESRRENKGRTYWTNREGAPDVETTAYALLAFLKFDDFKTCHRIVAWLTEQSRGIGMWHTTQDTVVAMQALATYSARTHNTDGELEIIIRQNNWMQKTNLDTENSLLDILIPNLPVDHGDRKFEVSVTGTGSGILKIDMFYNRKALDNETSPFIISPIDINDVDLNITNNQNLGIVVDRKCDICGFCKDPEEREINYDVLLDRRRRQANSESQGVKKCVQFSVNSKTPAHNTGMSIVKVDLQTGVRVVESDLKDMQDAGIFPRFEIPRDPNGGDVPGGFIIFYVNNITTDAINFKFRLNDNFLGNSSTRQPASIHVYDYYKPERSCIKPYGIGTSQGEIVRLECNETTDQCECMQSQCVKPVEEELVVMGLKFTKETDAVKRKQLKKPLDALLEYACDFTKANNVIKVNVKHIGHDSKRDMKVANATIEEVLLQGGNSMTIGDQIDLEWFVECKTPTLVKERTYYIIGKDGTSYSDNKAVKKYALGGTALVIDPEYPKPLLGIIMKNFAQALRVNKGCIT